ncbi:CHAT domain-containing tetratricopeptide repeat protein [Calothrix sp. UHCC 0171]|uniref:CHAT domain-containing tetratricopeptide repeat protein n=1 Tax=Calothrix sp. UHCC 0171 TaxID=3110245 RepID=UPI002B20C110|nr:CHAT domain-containing tetratricopeptide repeat protein [Calothrix sp. UHCC 0171]MEA5573406.1 CHAT domain-containing tetratricopeptide repeat protein [Calothrix sp. UHCC 0171]
MNIRVFGWFRRFIPKSINGNKEAEADRLSDQGYEQYESGQFKSAVQSWKQASELYRELKDREEEAIALNNVGGAFYSDKNYQLSIEFFQKSLRIFRDIGDRSEESRSLRRIGSSYEFLRDYQQAIRYYQYSLDLSREIDDESGEALSLENLGDVYDELGQFQKAIEYYQSLLSLREKIADRKGKGTSLMKIGNTLSNLKQDQKAIELHQQALEIAREVEDEAGEAFCLGNLGSSYNALGQHEEAVKCQQQSLSILRKIGNRSLEARCLNNLGVTFRDLGYSQQAIESYQQSLKIKRELGNKWEEADTLENLGRTFQSMGQYQLAIGYHQSALEIRRELNDKVGESKSLNNLGIIFDSLGQYQKAVNYYEQALDLARNISDRSTEAFLLNNLGLSFCSQGKYELAANYYQDSLSIKREIGERFKEANSLMNLGDAFRQLRQYQKAIEQHEQALEIYRDFNNSYGEANCLNNLGINFFYLGQYQTSISYYQQSLNIKQRIEHRWGEGLSLSNIGAAFFRDGQLLEAEKNFIDSIEVWEALRQKLDDTQRISIFEEQETTYRLLQEVLVSQDKVGAALEIAERGRTRALVDLLLERSDFSTLGDALEDFASAPSLKGIKEVAIQRETTLVEYSIIYDDLGQESKIYIWVVNPLGEIKFKQVDISFLKQEDITLKNLIFNSRLIIGAEKSKDATILSEVQQDTDHKRQVYLPLKKLYEILIAQIISYLPKSNQGTVTFIPQDALFLVPFAALQDFNNEYLIEKFTITISPSIQVLYLIVQRQKSTDLKIFDLHKSKDDDWFLVVGNPTMPLIPSISGKSVKQLASLPGASAEANAIAALFDTKALIGAEATKVEIEQRMLQARLIHLATHGLLDDIRQLGIPGAIALAPSPNDTGFLTAGDILHLELNAELVVLSACLTGLGNLTGDGVVGLSRCLMAAGIPRLIVSLWSVDDLPTAFLMIKFYNDLKALPSLEPGDIARLLKHAQTWLLSLRTEQAEQELEKLKPYIYKAFSHRSKGLANAYIRRYLHEIKNHAPYPFSSPLYWSAFTAIGL